MRSVVIVSGVYGRRDSIGRVRPVAKGDQADLPDEEAARLVTLGIAAYTDGPAAGPCVPGEGGGESGTSMDTPGGESPAQGTEAGPGAFTEHTLAGGMPAPLARGDGAQARGGDGAAPGPNGEDSADGAEGEAEVSKLERMPKAVLEQMARDMGVDISEARNNHERAVLIVAADEESNGGEAPPDLGVGDIVV